MQHYLYQLGDLFSTKLDKCFLLAARFHIPQIAVVVVLAILIYLLTVSGRLRARNKMIVILGNLFDWRRPEKVKSPYPTETIGVSSAGLDPQTVPAEDRNIEPLFIGIARRGFLLPLDVVIGGTIGLLLGMGMVLGPSSEFWSVREDCRQNLGARGGFSPDPRILRPIFDPIYVDPFGPLKTYNAGQSTMREGILHTDALQIRQQQERIEGSGRRQNDESARGKAPGRRTDGTLASAHPGTAKSWPSATQSEFKDPLEAQKDLSGDRSAEPGKKTFTLSECSNRVSGMYQAYMVSREGELNFITLELCESISNESMYDYRLRRGVRSELGQAEFDSEACTVRLPNGQSLRVSTRKDDAAFGAEESIGVLSLVPEVNPCV